MIDLIMEQNEIHLPLRCEHCGQAAMQFQRQPISQQLVCIACYRDPSIEWHTPAEREMEREVQS